MVCKDLSEVRSKWLVRTGETLLLIKKDYTSLDAHTSLDAYPVAVSLASLEFPPQEGHTSLVTEELWIAFLFSETGQDDELKWLFSIS